MPLVVEFDPPAPVPPVAALEPAVLFWPLLDTPTAMPTAAAAMMTSPMGTPKNSQRRLVGLVGTHPRGGLYSSFGLPAILSATRWLTVRGVKFLEPLCEPYVPLRPPRDGYELGLRRLDESYLFCPNSPDFSSISSALGDRGETSSEPCEGETGMGVWKGSGEVGYELNASR